MENYLSQKVQETVTPFTSIVKCQEICFYCTNYAYWLHHQNITQNFYNIIQAAVAAKKKKKKIQLLPGKIRLSCIRFCLQNTSYYLFMDGISFVWQHDSLRSQLTQFVLSVTMCYLVWTCKFRSLSLCLAIFLLIPIPVNIYGS